MNATRPPIQVKKFGGTSLATVERIQNVAANLVGAHREGSGQVVVVSAMGSETDRLLQLARRINTRPNPRELDMLLTTGEQVSIALLAMAIHKLGVEAVSMTGAQCGILTDGNFSRARIRGVKTARLWHHLDRQEIVIVAGFQGVSPSDEITTLGRGGSDTTATALAAALRTGCEIFTDVDGVFTADPRLVPEASLLEHIGYDEMLEYAASGSRVLHPRCVEIAKKFNVPLTVRSSFHEKPGTRIVKGELLEQVAVTGVTSDRNVARVVLTRVKDQPGIAAVVSEALATAGINILLIIQSLQHGDSNDISLIVGQEDGPRAVATLEKVVAEVGAEGVDLDAGVAKVSIIGSGIASTPGVAATLFRALADEAINIQFISSSEVRIACIISEDQLERAVRAVHRAFQLDRLSRSRKS